MKSKYILAAILLLLCSWNLLSAQQVPGPSKNKIKFQSLNLIGMLEGGYGSSFHMQSINGIRYKTYSLGIGVGIESYYQRAVPLFIDLRKEIRNKKNTPFIYGDAGLLIPWEKKSDKLQQNDFRTGFTSDLGLGYKCPIGNNAAFLMSAGYSYQSFSKYGWSPYTIIFDRWLNPALDRSRFDYKFHRISVKVGLSF